ncbi:MAG: response regulator [Terrimicrobiaceae bacterium]
MSSCPLRIFLVENHDDSLACLTGYLENCGYEVQGARSMDSALRVLAAGQVDVLICDIGLPDGDGWQLMRRVGEMKGPSPFGIAMSGYGTRSDIEKSRLAGYRHHLVKPFLPEELDTLIKAATAQAGKNRSHRQERNARPDPAARYPDKTE